MKPEYSLPYKRKLNTGSYPQSLQSFSTIHSDTFILLSAYKVVYYYLTFGMKLCKPMIFRFLQCVLHVLPASSPLIYHEVNAMKFRRVTQCSPSSNASIFSDPNIRIYTTVSSLFSDTFSLCPAIKMLHPYAFKLERHPSKYLYISIGEISLPGCQRLPDTVLHSVIRFKYRLPDTAPLPTSGNYSAERGKLGLKIFRVSSKTSRK